MPKFDLDGAFWRRLARLGARGPEWFVRYSPPIIGVAICAISPKRRHAIAKNLRRVRGPKGRLRDSTDAAKTFALYASCLAEVLGAGAPGSPEADAVVWGEEHVDDALSDGRGILFATAHTAGWEAVGPALRRHRGLRVMIAEAAEPDAGARAIQDDARRAQGLIVTHVGHDALAGLPLLRHLREGGAVALQVDRVPDGARSRSVVMFGTRAALPEGPLRLAALTGAPIVPIFTARLGFRRYKVVTARPIRLERAAPEADFERAAQQIADALQAFVRAHPTQWFHFRDR